MIETLTSRQLKGADIGPIDYSLVESGVRTLKDYYAAAGMTPPEWDRSIIQKEPAPYSPQSSIDQAKTTRPSQFQISPDELVWATICAGAVVAAVVWVVESDMGIWPFK